MTTGLLSDEVAEDYKNSLEDLTLNSRYEISNLTVIAKENVDHALAISRVIETHIRNASPNRKLPALYVLDSVVKNVGTPYTLFFERNLYQTFMDAYTLVDGAIRRKLEEMLKTWKEPVPGSLDSRPVFPIEVTRRIENALIKARTAAIQLQQQQAKTLQGRAQTSWRGTSTPSPGPQGGRVIQTPTTQLPGYALPARYGQGQATSSLIPPEPSATGTLALNGSQATHYPLNSAPRPNVGQYTPNEGNVQQGDSLESLHGDLIALITIARAEFAGNPYDPGIQQRLKALLDLQTILQSQHLPPDQLQLIRDQVAQLSSGGLSLSGIATSATLAPPVPAVPSLPATATSSYPPIPPASLQESLPQATASLSSMQPMQPMQSLLTPNALAALLSSVTNSTAAVPPAPHPPPLPPQPQMQPPMPQPLVSISQPPVHLGQPHSQPQPLFPSIASGPQPLPGAALLESLRAAGLITPNLGSAVGRPQSLPAAAAPTYSTTAHKPSATVPMLEPAQYQAERSFPGLLEDVELTAASLKIPRPHLIASLYEARPNQCGTCGRRFLATEEGKKRKARHLDWHFKVNSRMADAVKRGQHRSWYVDELEWIRSRDHPEDEGDEAAAGDGAGGGAAPTAGAENGSSASSRKAAPKQQWLPAPTDPATAHITCPICQEQFETVWHDEAQEWVWMDAVKIKGRIYHASCHAEASRDGASTTPRLTPDPPPALLGKRKAEDTPNPVHVTSKIKKELES